MFTVGGCPFLFLIYQDIGHSNAGKINPFSAMFPDQVEFLNNISSNEMEGLKPLFESMTFELLMELYYETYLAGNDPRKLDSIIGRWGLDSTRRGVDTVQIYGARQLVGTLGQSSGAELFEAGASVLEEDQALNFGVIPQMMGFTPNHQGFDDYPYIVAFFESLGLGRVWVVYEASKQKRLLFLLFYDGIPSYGYPFESCLRPFEDNQQI